MTVFWAVMIPLTLVLLIWDCYDIHKRLTK